MMVFLSSFLPCVKWVSTSVTPAAHLWPFLLLSLMEAIKSCAVAASPQYNHCIKQNHKIACLDGEMQFYTFFSKSTGWSCCPIYYSSYKLWKNSFRFHLHALYYLAMDVATIRKIFMHESHTLFPLVANSILKNVLLYFSYKIMMPQNITVTG